MQATAAPAKAIDARVAEGLYAVLHYLTKSSGRDVFQAMADAVDLKTALTASALAPALGVVLCLLLPAPAQRARVTAEQVAQVG